ncbi:MAG TPA: hypothetical protein DEE98_04100 [Elusimicrobia bacterium]|nr:MAG: hypothetical protein A2278_07110 [Elusimicrobia bacterium RIFOXYA12_FULL_49_49]OGS16194.1 MAG: hypothetical protein A2251_01075 [Elusimicrobia bacterium RIFOXYA2_FULL_47_53]OGS26607.1 MAG: hypothetical protein A2339_04285 [Elusimicrobia bacterium RIFOXYB12_FULL_50_12]OGS31348.1 MAG: hypothetical protein A2323_09365 [Elusimicrobia bacterium RIFOXYB2_FULL_46_23]HBU69549.1 hypothetical protein [Elusimicrobiota bacterium]
MKNDIKFPFAISLLLHLSLFIAASLTVKKSNYIILPVELAFYGPPPSAEPVSAAPPAAEKPAKIEKKSEGDVNISKKKKTEVKAPKELPAPRAPASPQAASKPSAPGIPGAAAGSSSQISYDTASFPYAYYTSTIVKKIGRNWQWSTAFGRIKAVVYFRISKDGVISELKLKESSGDGLFDQQALRSVAISGPFPPLPQGYAEEDLGVYFEFSFRE